MCGTLSHDCGCKEMAPVHRYKCVVLCLTTVDVKRWHQYIYIYVLVPSLYIHSRETKYHTFISMYWCHLFTSTVVRQSTTHLYLCTGAISLHPQSLDKVEFGFWFHEGWVSRCYPLFLSDIISSFSYICI
jgi:hypothetical protein